jgi:hypothetical protein
MAAATRLPGVTRIWACFVLAGGAASPRADAQQPSRWYDRLELRRTFDKQYAARPALLQWSRPAGDTARVTIAAGVRYRLASAWAEVAPFLEYQRDPEAASPQDLVKAGATLERQVWDYIGSDRHRWTPLVLGQIAYKRDRLKDAGAVQTSVSTTALARPCAGSKVASSTVLGCVFRPDVLTATRLLGFRYLPYLGIEHEVATTSGAAAPSVFRGLASAQTQWYPLPRQLDYRVQLTADWAYRRGSHAETKRLTRDHQRFDAGVNVFLLRRETEDEPDRAAGVSLLYTNGADPANALERQESTKIAFTIQF